MPRPRKFRKITGIPRAYYYKPQGVPLRDIEITQLSIEEWESIRLKSVKKLSQTEAANEMNTSQSSFQRIYSKAIEKIAIAITNGHAIRIDRD